jgi:MerR family transcriptional regulator, heat shock protein HspR
VARRPSNQEQAIYVISVAAELAGVHPQTLRVYERKGLVQPSRTAGNTRRYSDSDISLLRRIQELTNEGINLAGVERVLELEDQLERLQDLARRLTADLEQLEAQVNELLWGRSAMAIVPARDVRRIRRAMKSDEIDRAGQRRVFPTGPAGEHE